MSPGPVLPWEHADNKALDAELGELEDRLLTDLGRPGWRVSGEGDCGRCRVWTRNPCTCLRRCLAVQCEAGEARR